MVNREQTPDFEDDSIDLLPIFQAWLKKWRLIVIVMLLCGIAAMAFTKVAITPMYRSSFSVYINNKTNQDGYLTLTSSDLSASRSLAKTYSVIITSEAVLERAAEKAGYTGQYDELSRYVTTEIETDTEIIRTYVSSTSPANAKLLAQAVGEALEELGPEIVEGSSLKILDRPREPKSPYSPSVMKNTLIAAFVGAFVIVGIITLQTVFNTTLTSETVLEERFGLPILGTIPRQEDAEAENKNGYSYGYSKRNSEVKKDG